jgi:uncharacterized membrane protein YdjX (TVP38/TMEM64 family)|uniref:VTT domain-containing protein n=1 Tax=Attheya septentrionalis TaxID=420275 RepID=A0A7S2UL91_9STRA|mmetsp:Transcript_3272/g.5959  ORF Transcript_3272/g.5959 Transcript_3272/m.5959 type:complete len:237 (+) Transcript_3272:84-794(+)|eukprot:CAMPEP_0198297490 /NCGR_PEP_ID=MMETSP1449-20131203/36931_1 /TAXON_ID=420275 /ORGANISM="Attheya septentrionalis, Strain CCMP2084" /LENGTH=236 /DNA_ID=CAMNT_0043998423 /DNA_START=65 /DNA_END=775 /DNA_ORIENTATION=+
MTFVTIETTARAALLASVSQRRQHAGVAALSMISDGLLQVQDMAQPDFVGQAQHLVSMVDYSSMLSPATAIGIPSLQVLVSSLLLVTASDMVPFVPCQPLAISMGATLGIWAFPICVTGQSMAGILAFLASRKAADSQQVQQVLDGLGSQQARDKFQEIRQLGTQDTEEKVLLALIGLRLAPFFPFSAGNYLLGGGTGVGLRPFIIATIFGCLLSNLLSVSIGIGGSELLQSQLPS